MRLIFAGSPDFSVPGLEALVAAGHDVVAVYTQPDRPAGRGRKLTANPVKQAALEINLPVCQPLSLKTDEALAELQSWQAEAMIVAAYGLILPQAVLDAFPAGCINVHASLLPRWRGAAPIQRAIQVGDSESGVTIMQMALGLDTGDMLAKVTCPITAETTGASLHDELAAAGASLLVDVLADLPVHQANAEVQDDELANYAHKLQKAESQLDWHKPATELDRQIRAFNPWPGTQTRLVDGSADGLNVKVWAATPVSAGAGDAGQVVAIDEQGITVACGDGQLLITELQPAGKRRMSASDFGRSRQLQDASFS